MANRKYLIVVRTEEDKHDMIATLHTLVPEEYVRRATTGKDARFWVENGDEYVVWSIEQWWEGTTCGAMFDQIMYLAHPVPKFVTDSLLTCERVSSKETP